MSLSRKEVRTSWGLPYSPKVRSIPERRFPEVSVTEDDRRKAARVLAISGICLFPQHSSPHYHMSVISLEAF